LTELAPLKFFFIPTRDAGITTKESARTDNSPGKSNGLTVYQEEARRKHRTLFIAVANPAALICVTCLAMARTVCRSNFLFCSFVDPRQGTGYFGLSTPRRAEKFNVLSTPCLYRHL
jgi:hypothetical protein